MIVFKTICWRVNFDLLGRKQQDVAENYIIRPLIISIPQRVLLFLTNQGIWKDPGTFRREENCILKFYRKSRRKGNSGKTYKCEDIIKMRSRKIGWENVDLINLYQDRAHMRALMNKPKNFEVHPCKYIVWERCTWDIFDSLMAVTTKTKISWEIISVSEEWTNTSFTAEK
jgi:hypothetical protein